MDYSHLLKLPDFVTKNVEYEHEKHMGEGEIISKDTIKGYDGNEYIIVKINNTQSQYNGCWYLSPIGEGYEGFVFSNNQWISLTIKGV